MQSPLKFAVVAALLLAGCSSPGWRRGHEVLGVVAEIAPDKSTVTLSHEDIPGVMKGMVMPFKVQAPSLLDGLDAGDEVRFHLVVEEGKSYIDRIDRLAGSMPPFDLYRLDGTRLGTADLKGKVLLINFWATWCAPCRVEIPWFVEFKKEFGDRGLEIVGIAMDPENREDILRFQNELKINYPIVLSDDEIADKFGGIRGLPTTFVVDTRGRIVGKHLGLVPRDTLLRDIKKLL